MGILGYKPYHMAEIVTAGGVPHMKIAAEAVAGCHNNETGSKRYSKADYDKWFAEYDVSLLLPLFITLCRVNLPYLMRPTMLTCESSVLLKSPAGSAQMSSKHMPKIQTSSSS